MDSCGHCNRWARVTASETRFGRASGYQTGYELCQRQSSRRPRARGSRVGTWRLSDLGSTAGILPRNPGRNCLQLTRPRLTSCLSSPKLHHCPPRMLEPLCFSEPSVWIRCWHSSSCQTTSRPCWLAQMPLSDTCPAFACNFQIVLRRVWICLSLP